MRFSIEPTGGENGLLLGFEPADDESDDRFEVLVDGRLAAIVERPGDAWIMRDVGQLGFGSMSFAGELDEHALAGATLDALGDWIDEHRRDLHRPI
jgi:hypothetical protein